MMRTTLCEAVDKFVEDFTNNLSNMQEDHELQRELLYKDRDGHSAIDHHTRFGEEKQRKPSGFLKKLVVASAIARKNSVQPLVEKSPPSDKNDPETGSCFSVRSDQTCASFIPSGNSQPSLVPIDEEVEDLKAENLDEMVVVKDGSLA